MSRSQELGDQREVELAQGTIRYRERGSGEPIVFLHGLLVNGDLWRKVVPALAKDFRCISPDLPLGSHDVGMKPHANLTPPGVAKLIADFIEALDLNAVTLVANDTGAALCQIVVTEHPARIGRLVLTPGDSFEVFFPRMFKYLSWVARMPGGMYVLAQSMRVRALRRLPIAYGWLAKRPIDRAASDSYVRPVAESRAVRHDVSRFLKSVSPECTLAAASKLHNFDRPTLIAWAAEDRLFPFALAERLAATLPNARLERIENSWTYVPEDQPERLAELIAAFLREPQAAPQAEDVRI